MTTPAKVKAAEAAAAMLRELRDKRIAFGKRITEIVNEAHRLGLHETGHRLHDCEAMLGFEIERMYRRRE